MTEEGYARSDARRITTVEEGWRRADSEGFERCQADPCIFWHRNLGKVVVIIAVYVDYLHVLSAKKQGENQALEDFRSSFPIRYLGEISY